MTDPQYLECYVCGQAIESEDELVNLSAGWESEFQVACHWECAPDQLPANLVAC